MSDNELRTEPGWFRQLVGDDWMTPELEAQIKDQIWERIRQRLGDAYVTENATFLDAQWEWVRELRMIDEETDLTIEA